ncbi:MAG: biopolymer transporter ExbD [Bacteroidota bacterium]
MAEIIENDAGKKSGGKRRPKKHSTHIDMTPMVDLMCLLITFFMLTTAFNKPKVMEITMPEKTDQPDKDRVKVDARRTVNILLTEGDKIYYYEGAIEKDKPVPTLVKSNFGKDGIRKYLLERNKIVFKEIYELKEKVKKGELVMTTDTLNAKIKEKKKIDPMSPIILIKADEKTKYRNVVDIIDEMAITNIASYAVVDMSPDEIKLLEAAPK